MQFVYSPDYEANIGRHVFPTSKFRLVRESLLEQGLAVEEDFAASPIASREELALVHTEEYLDDFLNARASPRTTRSELPISESIVNAYVRAAGGSILASRIALSGSQPICCHLGGGFHHAFAAHAEGFCYINDIAVAIRLMQAEKKIQKAAVIDCDLHQGNGTAHLFQGDPSVFTFSIHQENNYPVKEQSDLDVGLHDLTADDEYLAVLHESVQSMLDSHKPELVVYVAGADPYLDDQLGGLRLTIHGLEDRDRMVLSECLKRGIPAISVTAGGYAHNLKDTVAIHTQTCKVALELLG